MRVRSLFLTLALSLLATETAVLAREDSTRGFAVAPYLLEVTADSAVVAFHLHHPLPAEVLVETETGTRRFASPAASRSHAVHVTGLSPGRIFTYEVVCGGGRVRTPRQDPSFQIRTAVLPGESFTFAVYGDPRPGESLTERHHRMIIDQILMVEPAFCLVLGDMVDDGAKRGHWERFFAIESELRRRSAIFPVPGDNDHAGGRGLWETYFPRRGSRHYHFEWGGLRFFGMNAWGAAGAQLPAELDESSVQVRWLRRELQRPEVQRAPFRVLFLHDPIFVSRGRSAKIMRRAWGPLLSRLGVDIVFASWHIYERSRHGGVTHVISGGAGAELVWLRPDPAFPSLVEARRHHFCRVDVKQGALQVRAIAEDGTVLDSFTLFPRSAGVAAAGHEGPAEERTGHGRKILPLLLLFLILSCGFFYRRLARLASSHPAAFWLALTLLFFAMALLILYDLTWRR